MFTGCNGLAIEEKIIGNYYFVAADDGEGCSLSYHKARRGDFLGGFNYVGIIGATVFAVGYNDKYMIVKQHPRIFPNPPNREITNYYILSLKDSMEWQNKNGLIGPLTLELFNQKCKDFNILNIYFTNEIKGLK